MKLFQTIKRGLVLVGIAALAKVSLAGPLETAAPSKEERAQIRARLQREVLERRKAIAARRAWKNMRVYKDKNGVLALTNRPDKYWSKRDFVEFVIHYDPIDVPQRYQGFAFLRQYTGDEVTELARYFADRYQVDENLVLAIIKVESDFDPKAVSSAGARGLMQLMPATAAEMGVTDIFDPAQNIAGGTQYFTKLLNLFKNDQDLALAAYNAGPATVKRYDGIPPFRETRVYVRRVKEYAKRFEQGGVQLARLGGTKRYEVTELTAPESEGYMIHFHNGLTQPADVIIEHGPHYYVQYDGRTHMVRKKFVKEIVPPENV